jgi:pyrimidine-nucleoside phosphorylase
MVEIGESVGRRTVALLSDMNQPLGCAVGNALEVAESIDCLRGGGPRDLREHCLTVAGYMLCLARRQELAAALPASIDEAAAQLASSAAFEKFRALVAAQGGDVGMVNDPSRLPHARIVEVLTASQAGYVARLNALQVGLAAVELGAGRERKEDSIDHAVGIVVHKKVGDAVTAGESVFTLHANDPERLQQALARLQDAVQISERTVPPLPMFYDTIAGASVVP